jgi:hypothetical protein
MTQPQLAHVAVVPLGVIIDFETDAGSPRDEDLDAMQDALERAGVEFIDGDRPGVRLRKGWK